MALARKKSRTITVQGETWYWRTSKFIRMDEASKARIAEARRLAVEKNPELKKQRLSIMFGPSELKYVRVIRLIASRSGSPPLMLEAEFDDYDMILPKVVAAAIAYAINQARPHDRNVYIPDATKLFEKVLAESSEKESNLSQVRYAQYKLNKSREHEQNADRNILEGNIYDAIQDLYNSLFYDLDNSHKLRKLDRLLGDQHASARLYNYRAFCYYKLHRHDPRAGHLEKAYQDSIKAIEMDPEYAIAYGTLAEILYVMSDTEGFYAALETALEKGMTQKIDGEISFELREAPAFLALLDRFSRRDWIRHY